VIPTNKASIGDIILVNGKPKVVREVKADSIRVFNFETSAIEDIVPERHVFMGNTYFYGKIVSMFGNNFNTTKDGKKKSGPEKIMQYMMLSSLFKNKGNSASSTDNTTNPATNDITTPFGNMDMSNMMPLMLMSGGNFGNMFDGMFDFDDDEDDDDEESNTTKEE
jgi:hypothetical protein